LCKLEDIIDKSPLLRIKESFDKKNQTEFVELLQQYVLPNITNNKLISFTAWKFNVTGTVYSQAKPNDADESI